ncbi:MAG: hypothetical protein KC635_11455, partial [Myxococcales bacterium]|nr:hypothetical protein [Myxococcales bacterium]
MARPRTRTSTSLSLLAASLGLAAAPAALAAPSGAPLASGRSLVCESERGTLEVEASAARVTPKGASRAIEAGATWASTGPGLWNVAIETDRGQRFAFAMREDGRGGWELGLAGAWTPCGVSAPPGHRP